MNTNQNDGENTPPVYSADCGRVRASIWANTVNGLTSYKVIISRSFEKNGEWLRGKTFYDGELSAVVEVTARAQIWIGRHKRKTQAQLQLAVE